MALALNLFREFDPTAWELYVNSFPKAERRPQQKHIDVLKERTFYPCNITEEGSFIGIMYYWIWGDFCFVEHLATEPMFRGSGLGAQAMGLLLEQTRGKVVILEVDPPVTEIAARRQKFYERQGFHTNKYEHIHPSFETPGEPHQLIVMSHPRTLTQMEFDEFRRYSLGHIIR